MSKLFWILVAFLLLISICSCSPQLHNTRAITTTSTSSIKHITLAVTKDEELILTTTSRFLARLALAEQKAEGYINSYMVSRKRKDIMVYYVYQVKSGAKL